MMFQVAYGLGIEPYELVRQIQEDNADYPVKSITWNQKNNALK
jgi:hypothetical protein